MMKKLLLLIVLLAGLTARAQDPVPHPRLLMREGEEAQVNTKGRFEKADSVIVAFSNAVLSEPVVKIPLLSTKKLSSSTP